MLTFCYLEYASRCNLTLLSPSFVYVFIGTVSHWKTSGFLKIMYYFVLSLFMGSLPRRNLIASLSFFGIGRIYDIVSNAIIP